MMSSKPLIIIASARKESDTAKLVRSLFLPDEADVIDLLDHSISHYRYDGTYPPEDQFLIVVKHLLQHDKIVFATPVYWYAMSGLMKVLFDRLTDLVTLQKEIGRGMRGKQTFLIAVGAEQTLPLGFEEPFRLTSDYLAMNFKATYYCKNSEIDVKDDKADLFKQLVYAKNEAR